MHFGANLLGILLNCLCVFFWAVEKIQSGGKTNYLQMVPWLESDLIPTLSLLTFQDPVIKSRANIKRTTAIHCDDQRLRGLPIPLGAS